MDVAVTAKMTAMWTTTNGCCGDDQDDRSGEQAGGQGDGELAAKLMVK
jgi:hypothetical protein